MSIKQVMHNLIIDFKNDIKKVVRPDIKTVVYFAALTIALAIIFALFFIVTDRTSASLVQRILGA